MNKINLGSVPMGNGNSNEFDLPQADGMEINAVEAQKPCSCGKHEYLTRKDVCYSSCEDNKCCDLGELPLDGQGRILELTLKLRNVCPGKRVAVGIVLTEVDEHKKECPRGQKIITVPAHDGPCCKDIPIRDLLFVMPEDLSMTGCADMCRNCRHFIVRVAAHYIDVTSNCCCAER